MAEFYVRHSLSLHKAVKFNITLRYIVTKTSEGDHLWVLEIGTTYPDVDGNQISARKKHLISISNLDELIENTVSEMCALIDWSPFVNDVDAPFVYSVVPISNVNVSIESDVYFTIVEHLPAAGIDLSELKVVLNNGDTNFDITSEVNITGDPYEYQLKWVPALRVYSTYEGV
jgi:hypothetical protein